MLLTAVQTVGAVFIGRPDHWADERQAFTERTEPVVESGEIAN